MPYIDMAKRSRLDPVVVELDCFIDGEDWGSLNYVITQLLLGMRPLGGWDYESLLKAHGTCHAVADEFYRRLIAPYEVKKIRENGDIAGYQELENESK